MNSHVWLIKFGKFGAVILTALIIYLFLMLIKRVLQRKIDKSLSNKIAKFFILNLVYAFLLLSLLIVVLNQLGISSSSLLAILGAGSLAIGLALKDSLSNVAAGILLIFERPFAVNDAINVNGIEGTVVAVNLYNTLIKQYSNEKIRIPNSTIINNPIKNISSCKKRRIDLNFYVDYGTQLDVLKTILLNIMKNNEHVLSEQNNKVFVARLDLSGVNIALQAWVDSANYAAVKADLLETIKLQVQKNNINFVFNPNFSSST